MVKVVRAPDAEELASARLRTGRPAKILDGPADVALQQLRGALRSAVHAFLELEIAVRKLELDRFDLVSRLRVGRPAPASKEIPSSVPQTEKSSEESMEK